MDHQKLKTMFLDYVKNYCTKILNLSASQCKNRINGCGLNYECPVGKRCEEDSTTDKGYVCKPGKDEIGLNVMINRGHNFTNKAYLVKLSTKGEGGSKKSTWFVHDPLEHNESRSSKLASTS